MWGGTSRAPARVPARASRGQGRGEVPRQAVPLRNAPGRTEKERGARTRAGVPLRVAGVLAVVWAGASAAAGELPPRAGLGAPVAVASVPGQASTGPPARTQKVTLRLHLLRGSTPPTWVRDFTGTQGARGAAVVATPLKQLADGWKVMADARTAADAAAASGSVDALDKRARRALAECPDLVTVGDAWLEAAVRRGLVRPLASPDEVDGYTGSVSPQGPPGLAPAKPWLGAPALQDADASGIWAPVLRRDPTTGAPDRAGPLYAFPYRVGGLVVAYRADLLEAAGVPPPGSWAELLDEPRLAGRVLFPAYPRDVVGIALKSLGQSLNADDPELLRGKALRGRVADLARQALVFESEDAVRPLQNGNAWVAVGWSHDLCRAAQRAPDVRVVVPREGTALTADLLCMPSARITGAGGGGGGGWGGGRGDGSGSGGIRGSGPLPVLADQFLRFAAQPARAIEMAASQTGAPPGPLLGAPEGRSPSTSRLISGSVLPPELCAGSEFQLPLGPEAHAAYADLVALARAHRDNAAGIIRTPAAAATAAATRILAHALHPFRT